MRSVDEPEKFKGFGEKVTPPKPAAPAPKPQGNSGIVEENGKLRTTTHIPRASLTLEEAVWNWREHYADEAAVDFQP